MLKILVVEDDIRLNETIKFFLMKKGFDVVYVYNATAALKELKKQHIDMIITDIMMPDIDGIELIKTLKKQDDKTPILIISAKGQFSDKEAGFLAGADDYMVKPIDLNEMYLRINSIFRRSKISTAHKLSFGNTTLDADSLTVDTNGLLYELPQKEFQILFKLLSYENKIFTRVQLMDEFWGIYTNSEERTIDTHINRLRDKFKGNPDFEIITIRGLGYKAIRHEEK